MRESKTIPATESDRGAAQAEIDARTAQRRDATAGSAQPLDAAIARASRTRGPVPADSDAPSSGARIVQRSANPTMKSSSPDTETIRVQRTSARSGTIQRDDDLEGDASTSSGGGFLSGIIGGIGSWLWSSPTPAEEGGTAEPEPEAEVVTPSPAPAVLSPESEATAQKLRTQLGSLAEKNTLILGYGPADKQELVQQRKQASAELSRKHLTDETVAALSGLVKELAGKYDAAEKVAIEGKRVAALSRAEEERRAAAEAAASKQELEEQRAIRARARERAGAGYPFLSPRFTDEELIDLLKLVESNVLQTLVQTFNVGDVSKLVAASTDKGARVLAVRAHVIDADHVTELLKVTDLGVAELISLLEFFTSDTLLVGASFLSNGAALLALARTSGGEDEWLRFLSEIKLTGTENDVTAALAVEGAGVTEAQAETEKEYANNGLIDDNGVAIKWMPYENVSGDGADNEQESVTAAMTALAAGTLAWRDDHANREGNLPGRRYVNGVYDEYLVAKPETALHPGGRRLVVHRATGNVYYSWTHYGQDGAPAFVRVK